MKTVKNYAEYIKLLKTTFDECERIPEEGDIQRFIDLNSLYDDWEILVTDVSQDIRTLVLMPKAYNKSSESKRILSYKQYLEKLHETFGIPETMPKPSQIRAFIDEYELLSVWGITEEDVSKDLHSFIDGKYDEMHEDAVSECKPDPQGVSKISPVILGTHTRSYWPTSYEDIPRSEVYTPPAKKHETIFLDGDNHIKEGQKGIERLPWNISVIAMFSQPGAKRKFDKKYESRPNVSSKLVNPGKQAVDNQIKTEAGQLLKKGNENVTIISHDKGFEKYRDRKKNRKDGNNITVAKSVKDRKSKSNKHKNGI